MPQKSLCDFNPPIKKPIEETKTVAPPPTQITNESEKKVRKRHNYPPRAPDDLPASYFVSATYDGRQKKAVVKLYEPISGNIYFWYDNTGHKPYCLTNLSQHELNKMERVVNHEGYDHCETVELFDPLLDRKVKVTKIVTNDPLAIGGKPQASIRDIIPEDFPKDASIEPKVWEAKIKYYQSYIYDTRYLPGMIYSVKNGSLVPCVFDEAEKTITKLKGLFKDASAEELEYIEEWARLIEYPAPKFRRAAIDIEVYAPLSTRVPDSREAVYPVVCCSLYASDDQKKVLVLKRSGVREGNCPMPPDSCIEYYEN